MDQELVQYLEEHFDRQEQRFNAGFDAIDRRFEGIDQRFDRQEQRFNARFDRIEQRLDLHNTQFASIDQRFVSIDERFVSTDDRFDELKRHTGVLVEGLRHGIQLVAEGLAMHIQVQHVQEREYHDQQHRETRALIRSFYDELRQQDEHIRQRVENLERKSPN
jgi:hypothetical protein